MGQTLGQIDGQVTMEENMTDRFYLLTDNRTDGRTDHNGTKDNRTDGRTDHNGMDIGQVIVEF